MVPIMTAIPPARILLLDEAAERRTNARGGTEMRNHWRRLLVAGLLPAAAAGGFAGSAVWAQAGGNSTIFACIREGAMRIVSTASVCNSLEKPLQ